MAINPKELASQSTTIRYTERNLLPRVHNITNKGARFPWFSSSFGLSICCGAFHPPVDRFPWGWHFRRIIDIYNTPFIYSFSKILRTILDTLFLSHDRHRGNEKLAIIRLERFRPQHGRHEHETEREAPSYQKPFLTHFSIFNLVGQPQ